VATALLQIPAASPPLEAQVPSVINEVVPPPIGATATPSVINEVIPPPTVAAAAPPVVPPPIGSAAAPPTTAAAPPVTSDAIFIPPIPPPCALRDAIPPPACIGAMVDMGPDFKACQTAKGGWAYQCPDIVVEQNTEGVRTHFRGGRLDHEPQSTTFHWCALNVVAYHTNHGVIYHTAEGVSYHGDSGTVHQDPEGGVTYHGVGGVTYHDPAEGLVIHWTDSGVFRTINGHTDFTPKGSTGAAIRLS